MGNNVELLKYYLSPKVVSCKNIIIIYKTKNLTHQHHLEPGAQHQQIAFRCIGTRKGNRNIRGIPNHIRIRRTLNEIVRIIHKGCFNLLSSFNNKNYFGIGPLEHFHFCYCTIILQYNDTTFPCIPLILHT